MEIKWSEEMRPGMLRNPVMYSSKVALPEGFIYPEDKSLDHITKLSTWGRTKGVRENDPHFIGVKGSTVLHFDPAYPRYSYQLKVRIDGVICCWGKSMEKLFFDRGTYYCLDTHSPHQVMALSEDDFNVAISLDSKEFVNPELVLPKLIRWGNEKAKLYV